MSRGKSAFSEGQLERAIRVAHGHGYQIVTIGGGKDGFTLTVRKPGDVSDESACANSGRPGNEWDEIFDDNGDDQTKAR